MTGSGSLLLASPALMSHTSSSHLLEPYRPSSSSPQIIGLARPHQFGGVTGAAMLRLGLVSLSARSQVQKPHGPNKIKVSTMLQESVWWKERSTAALRAIAIPVRQSGLSIRNIETGLQSHKQTVSITQSAPWWMWVDYANSYATPSQQYECVFIKIRAMSSALMLQCYAMLLSPRSINQVWLQNDIKCKRLT